jgi:hypothetical protein
LIATDDLFAGTGTFYIMRDIDLKPLEEIFRAKILKMLQKEGKSKGGRLCYFAI